MCVWREGERFREREREGGDRGKERLEREREEGGEREILTTSNK